MLGGCVSVSDVNGALYRVDRVWQLEYQKTEDTFRYRVVDGDYDAVFAAVRKTFIDLGMPIQTSSADEGYIVAENVAPNPLSLREWKEVADRETPGMKEVGGWYLYLAENPKEYLVIVKARLKNLRDKTLVVLDYALDSPHFRSRGINPPGNAPPLAVQLASAKFWIQLEKRLMESSLPPPRKRKDEERVDT